MMPLITKENPRLYVAFSFLFFKCPLIWNSFSVLLCLSWHWQFWKMQVIVFFPIEHFSLRITLIPSHDLIEVIPFFGKRAAKMLFFSVLHIKAHMVPICPIVGVNFDHLTTVVSPLESCYLLMNVLWKYIFEIVKTSW